MSNLPASERSKILIIKGNPITGEYKQSYYSNGLESALTGVYAPEEIKLILENSFNSLFRESKYLSEEVMKDRLFEFVSENADKIRTDIVADARLKALSACYNYFWEFPKIRPVIALTKNLENYPYALEILADYVFYLEEVKDDFRAKIVDGIRANCERRFFELRGNGKARYNE